MNKDNNDTMTSHASDHKREDYPVFVDADGEEWVTAEGAAAILHLSKGTIYHIKKHLTHRKGNSLQSRVFFLKRTLFEDYLNR